MTKDELVLPYKLEQHLVEICNANATYTNLLSVWNINKKMCQDALTTVVMNYPHYTRHDVSHCEAIITNIEMLLGEEAIRSLSPTDTWLLLHAAYLHDIGMVIECKRIEDNWASKAFQDYLHEMENSGDEALAQNAKFINSFGKTWNRSEPVLAWPVKVRYAVTLLIADYYRRRHAEDSRSYMEDIGDSFHIDLGFNGLIQQRLIRLVADIAYLHTEYNEKILELDYRTNGFNADYAHPRFLAQMLRMGDLLDADNNRFNATNEFVFGEIPESSRNHWEKHMSARHILITPDVIEYRADCSKPEVYRETRTFLSWLKDEVEFWALKWKDIMPENIKGSAPKLGKCELLLNGVPDIEGLSDLRFSISPEKAFEVIEGANIYEDGFAFLREVIQNALDACKIQMWRDISENRYRSWIKAGHTSSLQPFDIAHEVFENYSVEVRLCNYDEDRFKVIISDNGTGLSAEQLKKICHVGVSYFGDRKRKEEIESMPLWLRPTAGFGIGLQSIFLTADAFELYSKASGADGIYAKVTSRRKNGYVQITKSDVRREQGTEIHIILPKDLNFKYSYGGNVFEFVSKKFDPFSDENCLIYYKIWDVLCEMMENTLFPIKLFFEDKEINTFDAQQFEELEDGSLDNRYQYKLNPENYSMEIWDNKTCTRINICLKDQYERYSTKYFFKGMEVKEDHFISKGIWYVVDFYGLDTKKTLTLDRKKIRKEADENVQGILCDAMRFYLDEVEQTLFANKKIRSQEERGQIYTYWCIAPLDKKKDLLKKYAEVFAEVDVSIDILLKDENQRLTNTTVDFKDVIDDLDKVAEVSNLSDYIVHDGMTEQVNKGVLLDLLNSRATEIPFSMVIVDRNFMKALKSACRNKIMIFFEKEKKICLESYTEQNGVLLTTVNAETKSYLLGTLLKTSESSARYPLHDGGVRRYTVGLREHDLLCTTEVLFGVDGDFLYRSGYLISPVTIKQWEQTKHLPKEQFVDVICNCTEFHNLVDYVLEHSVCKENNQCTKERIEEEYRKFTRELYEVGKDKVEEEMKL